MNSRLFSVIIPTKNRKNWLKKCLDSILKDLTGNYSNDRYEVIIVDGGSQDGTAELVKTIDHVDIQYIIQDGKGLPNARNYGLKFARGSIIVFFDDDVIVPEGYFKKLQQTMTSHDAVGGVSGIYQRTADILSPRLRRIKSISDKLFTGGWVGKDAPVGRVLPTGFTTSNFEYAQTITEVDRLSGCNMAFPRYVIDKCGHFDESYLDGLGEDADFSFRVKKLGFRLIVNPGLEVIHENVEDKVFPYSERHIYYATLNHVYFFFKNLYDGKALSLFRFIIANIYIFSMYLIGSLIHKRPSLPLCYFRGLIGGLHRTYRRNRK